MIDRELHEEFGYCWHELESIGIDESFKNYGDVFFHVCKKCGFLTDDCQEECNPNYVAEPWLVIREIARQGSMFHERLKAFLMYAWDKDIPPETEGAVMHIDTCLEIVNLVSIDTTGKLAQLALDWMREQKEG